MEDNGLGSGREYSSILSLGLVCRVNIYLKVRNGPLVSVLIMTFGSPFCTRTFNYQIGLLIDTQR